MRTHLAYAAIGSVVLLMLAACDRDTQAQARNEAESVGRKVDQALDRTQEKLAVAGAKAKQELAEAGDKLQPKLEAAGDRIAAAGEKVAATVKDAATPDGRGGTGNATATTTTTTVTTGPRTSVTGIAPSTRATLGDAAITASIKTDFLKDPDLSVLRIDVDTRDGVVTLNGLADNEAARQRAEKMAGAVKGVREVRNYLAVKRG